MRLSEAQGEPGLGRRGFLAAVGLAALGACVPGNLRTATPGAVWGAQGRRDGDFLKPRAITWHDGRVYVIDFTGRVQVFSDAGAFLHLWSTPDASNGTPTAIGIGRDGRLLVPDTHYHRILEYSPGGDLLVEWGEYGTGQGQFIYPTGIAQHADGRYFVCEYGENAERIRVFDERRALLAEWGAHGFDPGQFNRAMALTLDGDLLHVADTTNHRIQTFTLAGELVRVIGGEGSAPGRLRFPFDIAMAPGGIIAAVEYGNNRVSLFARDGRSIGTLGGPGRAPGLFNEPRGVAVSPRGLLFVADTYNHRVQRFALEAAS